MPAVYVMAGHQRAGRRFVLKAQARRAGEHCDPFPLRLVVPEPFGARLTKRDDTLDAKTRTREDFGKSFLRRVRREIGEEIGCEFAHGTLTAAAGIQKHWVQ